MAAFVAEIDDLLWLAPPSEQRQVAQRHVAV